MKKFKRILALMVITLLLTNCGKEELKINQEVTLTGTVTTREITKDNVTKKVSILNLEEPIIIDGTSIHKIELDFDKALKENEEITIKGTITNNGDSSLNLDYAFSVSDIDDILSYINTFHSKDFSMTIPPELIKMSVIENIDNGFIIYGTDTNKNKFEVFRVICITNAEFKELNRSESAYIEKATSNKQKTVIVKFPTDDGAYEGNYDVVETIMDELSTIKKNIRLK